MSARVAYLHTSAFVKLIVAEPESAALSGELRSLDAIDLAAALSIDPEIGVIVSYDSRLRDAAIAQGCPVESPGA